MPDSIKFQDRKITDKTSGVQYVPFIAEDGRVGYECTEVATGKFEFLYFNPSNETDDGVANVFIYQGTENDPSNDTPHVHFTVLDDR
jgi:hypothetical protein